MNIAIRLPNWLGDMVMSTAFVQAVQEAYPQADIDLIAKKGIDFLLGYFPAHNQRFIFSKEEYRGIKGAWNFGKHIASQKKYDIFFSLPDSFSAALMGKAIGAAQRVGFNKELRSVLLTHCYTKPRGLHRVEEYVNLLQQFKKREINIPPVTLQANSQKTNAVIININSEAVSRRLPASKAVSIIAAVRKTIPGEIILVGSAREADFVNAVFSVLPDTRNVTNQAGKTSLPELMELFAGSKAVLTTDSGPAHVANALGVETIVLFGAGNEQNTAPYNAGNRTIIRLGMLNCEPCVSNTCKLYGVPECLAKLDENMIAATLKNILNK